MNHSEVKVGSIVRLNCQYDYFCFDNGRSKFAKNGITVQLGELLRVEEKDNLIKVSTLKDPTIWTRLYASRIDHI